MADVLSSIPGISGLANINYASYAVVILIVIGLLVIVGGVIFILILRSKTIDILEFDMVSHQIQRLNGHLKKDKSTQVERIWLPKYKKFIKKFQQQHVYYKKNRNVLILLKDLNGLHHFLQIANLADTRALLKANGVNIDEEFIDDPITKARIENPNYIYTQIYGMPHPGEDLNFLGDICVEANEDYKKKEEWWQSPTVAILGTAFICCVMVLGTIVLMKKLVS